MMNKLKPNIPSEIIAEIIQKNKNFPNNSVYPLLIYKRVFNFQNTSTCDIKSLVIDNNWYKPWVNSIYDYHHYHSNTHEALVIFSGKCKVQIGGNGGPIYKIEKGDVIIFPAGVSHKNSGSSSNFETVGCYPFDIDYDMNYGKVEELFTAEINIKQVPLPLTDPIFGKNGILFQYWKN